MTQRWAYVGDLGIDGALDWGGDWNGNVPTSGRLPDLGSSVFWKIMDLAERGEHGGRRVDWGAGAIKVNGPELRAVLETVYGAERLTKPRAPIDAYLRLAEEMGKNQYIAFVAAEL